MTQVGDDDAEPLALVRTRYGFGNGTAWGQDGHNAEFIAHAREDIPNLLTALEQSQANAAWLRSLLECVVDFIGTALSDYDARRTQALNPQDAPTYSLSYALPGVAVSSAKEHTQ